MAGPAGTTLAFRGIDPVCWVSTKSILEGFALELLQLRDDAGLLKARKVLDKDTSLQVIHLMLNTDGEQSFGLQLERGAFTIEGPYRNTLRTLNRVIDARNRQTPFLEIGRSTPGGDFRIDQHKEFIPRFGYVDHDHLLVDVDLRRGKTYARSGIHGFRHISDQDSNRIGHESDGLRKCVQALIRKMKNRKNGH